MIFTGMMLNLSQKTITKSLKWIHTIFLCVTIGIRIQYTI
nr:MAG TPA: transcriptional regulator [Bacteriophage sp.]